MNFALTLFFDQSGEDRIAALAQQLKKERGRKFFLDLGIRPHITLTGFCDPDMAEVSRRLKDYCASHQGFSITLGSVAISPELHAVFFAPVVTETLLRTHRELSELFADFDCSRHAQDAPGLWEAHCTMDLDDDLSVVVDSASLLARNFTTIRTRIDRIAVLELSRPTVSETVFGLAKQ